MADFSNNYGRPWRVGDALGQHEEAGIIIETIDGIAILITPGIDAIARHTGLPWLSEEMWRAYYDLATLIVKDHNDAIERETTEGRREVVLK